jgi:hypothetical protein
MMLMIHFDKSKSNYEDEINTGAEFYTDSSINTDPARMMELTPPTNLIQN